ncbi:YraN family protein [Candidatus Poribacteria bacterium]|nr:MAG: YraN family protein [Candidatus Poribacteria bacterium]
MPDTQKVVQSKGYRKRLGEEGERIAARFLQGKGYKILERNVRIGRGEIDIVALDGDTIVLVEVKARRGTGYGLPAEAVTPGKRRQLSKLALLYLRKKGWLDRSARFDVVSVLIPDDGEPVIEHIRNAFELSGGFTF